MEARSLLQWCRGLRARVGEEEEQDRLGKASKSEPIEHKEPPQPCDPVCVHGISMGGLHAAMTAALCPFEASVVGWLAPSSAVPVFTSGIMASAIEWGKLAREARER